MGFRIVGCAHKGATRWCRAPPGRLEEAPTVCLVVLRMRRWYVTRRGQRLPCRASTESTGVYCTTHWKRRQPSSRRPCARLSTAPARCGGGHGTFSTRCRVSEERARQGNTGARGPPAAARVRRPQRQGGKEDRAGRYCTVLIQSVSLCDEEDHRHGSRQLSGPSFLP